MFIGRPEKFFTTEAMIVKEVEIFKEMIKIDKYPGEETGYGGGD